MRGFYFAQPGYFSKEFCEKVKASSEDVPEIKAGIWDKSGKSDEARRSLVRWLPMFGEVHDTVHRFCIDVNKHFNFDLSHLESLQHTEYPSDILGHYDMHMDVDFYSGATLFDRKLSITIQLSEEDEYEGGEFCIQAADSLLKLGPEAKQIGTVIAFPSYIYHQVLPVTKGSRKSLVSWVLGPRWR